MTLEYRGVSIFPFEDLSGDYRQRHRQSGTLTRKLFKAALVNDLESWPKDALR